MSSFPNSTLSPGSLQTFSKNPWFIVETPLRFVHHLWHLTFINLRFVVSFHLIRISCHTICSICHSFVRSFPIHLDFPAFFRHRNLSTPKTFDESVYGYYIVKICCLLYFCLFYTYSDFLIYGRRIIIFVYFTTRQFSHLNL